MGIETAAFRTVAAAEGLSPVELRSIIDQAKAAKGEVTAHDKVGAKPQARTVTAEELFGNVPPALQSKPRQKYVFAPELLENSEAFDLAQKIANARNYKVRHKMPLTAEENALGLKANGFVNQARTRREQKRAERNGNGRPKRQVPTSRGSEPSLG